MIALTWLRGLLAHRRARAARPTALGVAVGVALLASIGTFLSATTVEDDRARERPASPSTGRSQVQPRAPTRPASVLGQVRRFGGVTARAAGGLRRHHGAAARPRAAARSRPGRARSSGSRRATRRPSRARCALLAGAGHRRAARPADRRQPPRPARRHDHASAAPALPPAAGAGRRASSTCPQADSLFQQVGAPVGAQPQAPPDNVVLLPAARRSRGIEAPLATHARTSSCTQVHARALARAAGVARAPRSPQVSGHARNLETRARRRRPRRRQPRHARSTRRARTRSTPQLLFLFLGVPGAILAGLVTAVDRVGRRRPAPPRRRAAAHARRLDAPPRRGSRSARPRWPACAGVALGLGAALVIGVDDVRHDELRRRRRSRRCSGAAAPRSAGSLIAAAGDRAARPGATRAR